MGTHTYAYTDLGQQERESHTAGPLAGWSVALQFDALSRRSRIDVAENSVVDTSTHYTYDTAGRFRTIGDGTSTATYDYLANRPHVQHITYSSRTNEVRETARSGGSGSEASTPGTENVLRTDKTYDALDRLTLIQHDRLIGAMDTVSSYAYTYNNANQRTRVDEVDGSYWLYGYDSLGQVTSGVKYAADGTPLPGHTFGYAYDDIGNRQTATTNGRTETYIANELNQYEQRTVPGAEDVLGTAASDAQVFVNQQPATRKDALWYGEVTADNSSAPAYPDVRVDAVKPGAGPNGEDVATTKTGNAFIPETPEVYSYDNDGNMTGDGRWIYNWSGENRLIQLETDPAVWSAVNSAMKREKFVFTYDHIGRRTTKEVYTWDNQAADWALETSIRFIYDGWNLLTELEPSDYGVPVASFQYQVIRSYTWGLDLSGTLQGAGGVGGLLFVENTDGTTMPLCDGNGNVMQYVGEADAVIIAGYSYNPSGQTLATSGDALVYFYGFSSKYADETATLYFGYRYYAPQLGRWLNRDPLGEGTSVGLHTMNQNNYLNYYDFLGLSSGKGDVRDSQFVYPYHDSVGQHRNYFEYISNITQRIRESFYALKGTENNKIYEGCSDFFEQIIGNFERRIFSNVYLDLRGLELGKGSQYYEPFKKIKAYHYGGDVFFNLTKFPEAKGMPYLPELRSTNDSPFGPFSVDDSYDREIAQRIGNEALHLFRHWSSDYDSSATIQEEWESDFSMKIITKIWDYSNKKSVSLSFHEDLLREHYKPLSVTHLRKTL